MTATQMIWQFLLVALGAYAIGNVNFALIISKLKKSDVRTLGSGNPGTMNMSRNFGIKIGALTLLLDMLKGFVPVFIAGLIFKGKFCLNTAFEASDLARYVAAFFVILGHVYPAALGFRGGKGIASNIGVYFAISPIFAAIVLVLMIAYVWWTEYGSLGSLLGITALAVGELFTLHRKYVLAGVVGIKGLLLATDIVVLCVCLLSWWAHRGNLVRLLKGVEHRTSIRDMIHRHGEKKAK